MVGLLLEAPRALEDGALCGAGRLGKEQGWRELGRKQGTLTGPRKGWALLCSHASPESLDACLPSVHVGANKCYWVGLPGTGAWGSLWR